MRTFSISVWCSSFPVSSNIKPWDRFSQLIAVNIEWPLVPLVMGGREEEDPGLGVMPYCIVGWHWDAPWVSHPPTPPTLPDTGRTSLPSLWQQKCLRKHSHSQMWEQRPVRDLLHDSGRPNQGSVIKPEVRAERKGLGDGREVQGRMKTYVKHNRLTHLDVWQRPTEYCGRHITPMK